MKASLLAAGLLLATVLSATAAKDDEPLPKATLSEFSVGKVISEGKIEPSDLVGKVVVLEFWGRH